MPPFGLQMPVRCRRDCCEAYLREHDVSWSSPKHRTQWRKTLAQLYPVLGALPVAVIDTPLVLLLIRSTNWLGSLIRFFERVRFRRPTDRPFAYWSHAALVVTSGEHLIEVLHTGVVLRKIGKYRNQEYHYVYLDLSESDRSKA